MADDYQDMVNPGAQDLKYSTPGYNLASPAARRPLSEVLNPVLRSSEAATRGAINGNTALLSGGLAAYYRDLLDTGETGQAFADSLLAEGDFDQWKLYEFLVGDRERRYLQEFDAYSDLPVFPPRTLYTPGAYKLDVQGKLNDYIRKTLPSEMFKSYTVRNMQEGWRPYYDTPPRMPSGFYVTTSAERKAHDNIINTTLKYLDLSPAILNGLVENNLINVR